MIHSKHTPIETAKERWNSLKIGDSFRNSNNNRTTVIKKGHNWIRCITSKNTVYVIYDNEFINRCKYGFYTNFKIATYDLTFLI